MTTSPEHLQGKSVGARLVSQSEADSFLSCERKWYYAHSEGIKNKSFGPGLTRGILGHVAFTAYYEALYGGLSVRQAAIAMKAALEAEAMKMTSPAAFEMLGFVYQRMQGYIEKYGEADMEMYEVLVVEQAFLLEAASFPFKPDVVMRERRTGKVILMDHKWLYRAYSMDNIAMLPQLAKYMKGLQDQGLPVDECCYNMVITDKRSKDPFQRKFFKPPKSRMETFAREQAVIRDRINALKELTPTEVEQKVIRNASSFSCPMCSFKEICAADLDKKPGRSLLLQGQYEPNDYKYYGEEIPDA